MNNKAIGVFDSGIGGLSVVREMIKILPNEDIVYFGDIARMPYGNKSSKIISNYASQSIEFLKSKNVKLIVAACGTVSSVISNKIYDYKIPIIDIIKPSCISAVKLTDSYKIGVMATESSINSNKYKKNILEINKNIEVFQVKCPILASIIENGFINESDNILMEALNNYLAPFHKKKIDVLILGCTHYPIIKNIIKKLLNNVKIVDPGIETAFFLKSKILKDNICSNKKESGDFVFYTSDAAVNSIKTAEFFLEKEIKSNIKTVNFIDF